MIAAIVIALAFLLQAPQPPPAQAQSFAECQAWLCLPGNYGRGHGAEAECAPAKQAVLSRLRQHLDPLPKWSSCAARFGWDAATLHWTQPTDAPCPHGGSLSVGLCRGIDTNGCAFTYTPRESGKVWVWVNGQRMDARYKSVPHEYVLVQAGARNVDLASCPPDCVDCGGTYPGAPPLVVGPPASTAGSAGAGGAAAGAGGGGGVCNTIACPHVQHGWDADMSAAPLPIHWTLRATPPVPPQ